MLDKIILDIRAVRANPLMVAVSNRGFHALLIYRIANTLYKSEVPLVPLILSRLIHILYAIDIDYRANIGPGVVIVHGVGVVIGQGAVVEGNTKIYHGVTLGIAEKASGDGYPHVEKGVILGAGSKILGPVRIGRDTRIGANAVVVQDIPAGSVATGIPARVHGRNL